MLRALALVLPLVLAPEPGRAHPHVFIDGGIDFLFDASGRLTDLRVTWIYDPLTSLFMLEDLGIDPAAALAPAERARVAAYQTEWIEGYDGDSYLWDGDRRVGLSGPEDPEAELSDGKVAISFRRALAEPIRPGPETVVKVYDPSYFTAYFVTETPRIEGAAGGCRARVEPFEPNGPLVALQRTLQSVGVDEDPEDQDVGALFAEKVHVACD
jgi:ABC-type uncharacterized transport system substrate-binding protein